MLWNNTSQHGSAETTTSGSESVNISAGSRTGILQFDSMSSQLDRRLQQMLGLYQFL